MSLLRWVLFFVLTAMVSPLAAEEAALPEIPVVKNWGDLLKAAPVVDENLAAWKHRATGELWPGAATRLKIRLGIDRSKSRQNDAAVIYCLVESKEPVGTFHDGPDSLGPLKVRFDGPVEETKDMVVGAAQADSGSPMRLYVQTVPFLKSGTHRIIVSSRGVGSHPGLDVAVATVEVSEGSVPSWLPWRVSERPEFDMSVSRRMINVSQFPAALPAGGFSALPVAPGGAELPLKAPPEKSDLLPRLIPSEPTLEILPLVNSVAVKLPEKMSLYPAARFFLLRWWLNGREQGGSAVESPNLPVLFKDRASDLAWFSIDSPPPDAREGDTVSIQLLFCPRGFQSLAIRQNRLPVDAAWPEISYLSPVADLVVREGRLLPKTPADGGAAFAPLTASQVVPERAEVTLRTARQEYFLGENVLVDFVLANKGADAFGIEAGGDYRGASRALRFKVTATDASGRAAEDPDPFPMYMGGRAYMPKIAPGEEWVESLPLLRYRRFDEPGDYTIRASHDFGWIETSRPRPVGETKITFAMPDAAQAEKIVEEMRRLPDDPRRSAGEASSPYADFTCLRYPVYLTPLSRLAWSGDRRALLGLGAIETPDATAELIKLLDHPDSALALEAALTLNSRLPDPEWAGQLPSRSPFRDGRDGQRKRLAKLAWAPRFAPAVRLHASRLMASRDPRAVAAGGFMVQAVGEPADLPPLLEELDRQLATVHDRKDPKDNILNAPSPVMELVRAGKILALRSGPLPKPSTPAAELVWLETLPPKPADRPTGWEDLLLPLLRSPSPLIREKAVNFLPSPLPPAFRAGLTAAFTDPDLGVRRAACDWVAESKDAAFRPQVLEVLKDAHHEWLFRSASNAAEILGARQAVARANIARLEDTSQVIDALRNLALLTVADFKGSSSGDSNRTPEEFREIKAAWLSFLDRHAADIDSGRKFRVGSPELSPTLFGRALRLQFDDGTHWP